MIINNCCHNLLIFCTKQAQCIYAYLHNFIFIIHLHVHLCIVCHTLCIMKGKCIPLTNHSVFQFAPDLELQHHHVRMNLMQWTTDAKYNYSGSALCPTACCSLHILLHWRWEGSKLRLCWGRPQVVEGAPSPQLSCPRHLSHLITHHHHHQHHHHHRPRHHHQDDHRVILTSESIFRQIIVSRNKLFFSSVLASFVVLLFVA